LEKILVSCSSRVNFATLHIGMPAVTCSVHRVSPRLPRQGRGVFENHVIRQLHNNTPPPSGTTSCLGSEGASLARVHKNLFQAPCSSIPSSVMIHHGDENFPRGCSKSRGPGIVHFTRHSYLRSSGSHSVLPPCPNPVSID
jgi:hypothetical protein